MLPWFCPLMNKRCYCCHKSYRNYIRQINQKEFTLEELAIYDGSNGKKAYVAVNGIIYDVSDEAAWGGGTHFGIIAGKDISEKFKECHGENEVLNKLPRVGVIKM